MRRLVLGARVLLVVTSLAGVGCAAAQPSGAQCRRRAASVPVRVQAARPVGVHSAPESDSRSRSPSSSPASGTVVKSAPGPRQIPGFTYLAVRDFRCGGNHYSIPQYLHDASGLVFHLLPGGAYVRGSAAGDRTERPATKVHVKPFLICATECTQKSWKQIMRSNPARCFGLLRPVDMVSWEDAQRFCRKIGLRLPTESEWEYACRAGSTAQFCFGEDAGDLQDYAWFDSWFDHWPGSHRVAEKKPNGFGLYDTHGNVWEWCEDSYQLGYRKAPLDGSAWIAPAGSVRVIRGGDWFTRERFCRSATRGALRQDRRFDSVGFRPAASLP